MTDLHTKNASFSIGRLNRRNRAVHPHGWGVHRWGAHWWALALAACSSDSSGGGSVGSVPTLSPLEPGEIRFQDATVVGNDTTVVLDGVFPDGSILTTNLGIIGSDNKLTIDDEDFTDGVHTVTIMATDANGGALGVQTIELVSDKTPTVATGLADALAVSAGTAAVIDLGGVFGGGSSALTIETSLGTIINNTTLSFSEADITKPTHTVTFTATDADADGNNDSVMVTVEFIADKQLIVANRLENATVKGNDATIDLNEVFSNGEAAFTIATSFGTIGTDGMLTLDDADFIEGPHTITLTATSTTEEATHIFVLVSDKTPTVDNPIGDSVIGGNDGTEINISNVFGGGSGELTLSASAGSINAEGTTLELLGSDLVNGANTVKVTATDSDDDTVTIDITINTNKSPTVNPEVTLADVEIAGNGGTGIVLTGAFGGGSGTLTYKTTIDGNEISTTGNTLDLDGAGLSDGENIIIVTATDDDGESVTTNIKITADKHPIVEKALATQLAAVLGTPTTIDLNGVFGGGSSDDLTLAASFGTIGEDNTLTIVDGDLIPDTTNTVTIIATDADADGNNDTVSVVVELVTDKQLLIHNALDDTTVIGNVATIDLSQAFSNNDESFTLVATFGGNTVDLGTGTVLTLNDAAFGDGVFTEGAHTITITATSSDEEVAEQVFTLVSDKSPTVIFDNLLATQYIMGNGGTTINIGRVFGHPKDGEVLALSASVGTVGADRSLTIDGAEVANGNTTIGITATDSDADGNNESVGTIFQLFVDKYPTVADAHNTVNVSGNGGTIIDIGGVFGHPTVGESLTLSASDGTLSGTMLDLSAADLVDGANTIELRATDSDPSGTKDSITSSFVVMVDKSPTIIATIIDRALAVGNDVATTIDISGVFGHPTAGESLTLSVSDGTIGTDNSLTISAADLDDGTNTIVLMATDSDSSTPDSVTISFVVTTDKSPTLGTAIENMVLPVGNDVITIIDVSGVFGHPEVSESLSLSVSDGTIGTDNSLTISAADLDDGVNTIELMATDSDSILPESVTSSFVVTTDKSPTVIPGAEINNASIAGNLGTTIDISSVFGHPKVGESLTLSASDGTIGTNNSLTLNGADLADGANTITLMATDSDTETAESVTSSFVITTNKSPTIIDAGLASEIVVNTATATVIDLDGVFGGGSRGSDGTAELTLTSTFGNIVGKQLSISDSDLTSSTHTVTITATDSDGETVEEVVLFVSDRNLIVVNAVPDAIVAGNSTIVDLTSVFGNDGDPFTITATPFPVGADNTLTLNNADFTEGNHTITITATDGNGKTLEDVFVLVSDKSPTVDTALAAESIIGNGGATINISNLFGHPVVGESLTLSASAGNIAGNSLTLAGTDLMDGVNTITITATDDDDADKDSVESTFVVTTNKLPVVAVAIANATLEKGNGGTVIDISGVFSDAGTLNLTASHGTVDNTNGDLILVGANLVNGTNTIILTATDADNQTATSSFVLTVDKIPTVANTVSTVNVTGNGGTAIDLTGAFDGGGDTLTYKTVYNGTLISTTGNTLTLPNGTGLMDGQNTIIVTATDSNGDEVTLDVTVDANRSPTIDTAVSDASITGNGDMDIDLNTVFGNAGGALTFVASFGDMSSILPITVGNNGTLTLDGDDHLVDGTNSITVTASDGDVPTPQSITDVFVLTVNKSPTVSTSIVDSNIQGNDGTTIDLTNVFDSGSGVLTLTASDGTIGGDNKLTLLGSELEHGTNSITVTATDADNETVTDVFEIVTTKTLSIAEDAIGTIYGARQHDTQTFDLHDLLITNADDVVTIIATLGVISVTLTETTLYTLTFDNTALTEGENIFTISANNGTDPVTHSLTYTLDTITGQSGVTTGTTYNGTTIADMITGNSFVQVVDEFGNSGIGEVTLNGWAGADTISSNSITATDFIYSIDFVGGDGDDMINNNTLTSVRVYSITFDGGAGDDTISDNTLTGELDRVTFDGGAGADTISDNTITGTRVYLINFVGGDGDDTISSNTLTTTDQRLSTITFDAGAGDDIIADNHFGASGTVDFHDVRDISLLGGAGNDLFRDNTATQANGESATLTIDGGVGEDTVKFRAIADEYTGFFEWTRGVTNIRLTGDGASVRLVNVETITFADGVSYNAADAWVEGNGEAEYDLANAFSGTFTGYTTASGTIGANNTLTVAATELGHGTNTIMVTATASDNSETTETITVNAVKTLQFIGLKQSNTQEIDLDTIFGDGSTYAIGMVADVTLSTNILTFDNTMLAEEVHSITITVTDAGGTITEHILTYDLIPPISNQTAGANTTYTGTDGHDMITGNMFSAGTSLTNVDLDGGGGNDTIGTNTFTADRIANNTLDGGEGDDTITNNTLSGGLIVWTIDFVGGAGNDTISNNTFTADSYVEAINLIGGDGNDTISGNILTALLSVARHYFDGGAGNDTISDNHFNATGGGGSNDAKNINLRGREGDDVFRHNTATQGSGLASITIDGGSDTDDSDIDKVYFELASSMFTITGAYGENITVTDDAKRVNAGDDSDVNSFAEYVLIDIEELYFGDSASAYVFS